MQSRKWNRKNRFFFVCGSGVAPVDSPVDAAVKWEEFRNQSMSGVSEVGNGGIVVNQSGEWICKVAYNGRMFFSRDEIGAYDRYLLSKLPQLQRVPLCAS